MAMKADGTRVQIPGVNWESVKKVSRMRKGARVVIKPDRIAVLNEAIHKLITIKKRRIAEGLYGWKVRSVQEEIDKLMKMKRNINNTEQYLQWLKDNKNA